MKRQKTMAGLLACLFMGMCLAVQAGNIVGNNHQALRGDTAVDSEAARRARMKAQLDAELKAEQQQAEEEEVYHVTEVAPEFPGGMQALINFISTNLKYPTVCKENGTQGRVLVKFTIRKDGSIGNIRVVRSVDPYLDKEAIRVVKAMPRWKPGTQGGKPVSVEYTVPFMFRLG